MKYVFTKMTDIMFKMSFEIFQFFVRVLIMLKNIHHIFLIKFLPNKMNDIAEIYITLILKLKKNTMSM